MMIRNEKNVREQKNQQRMNRAERNGRYAQIMSKKNHDWHAGKMDFTSDK
jgi:hypothetical protein